jgi:hypothetical protein
VVRFGRDEEDLASLDCRRRLVLDLLLLRAFEDIDGLFARMPVPRGRASPIDLDPGLDDLAPGNAEIVILEIGAPDPGLRRVAVNLLSLVRATSPPSEVI